MTPSPSVESVQVTWTLPDAVDGTETFVGAFRVPTLAAALPVPCVVQYAQAPIADSEHGEGRQTEHERAPPDHLRALPL